MTNLKIKNKRFFLWNPLYRCYLDAYSHFLQFVIIDIVTNSGNLKNRYLSIVFLKKSNRNIHRYYILITVKTNTDILFITCYKRIMC